MGNEVRRDMRKVTQDTSLKGFYRATSMADEDWWSELWPDPEGVLRKVGLAPGMKAVDLCCGYGWFTAPMARIAGPEKVVGVDLDPRMIEAAREHVRRQGAPECRWITGDASSIDEQLSEAVDFILVANVFHGVPDRTALAACAARRLKPGGRLVIINWHARPREETRVLGEPRGPLSELRMTPEQTRRDVEPAGFRLSEIVELKPYHYAAIFLKEQGRTQLTESSQSSSPSKRAVER